MIFVFECQSMNTKKEYDKSFITKLTKANPLIFKIVKAKILKEPINCFSFLKDLSFNLYPNKPLSFDSYPDKPIFEMKF